MEKIRIGIYAVEHKGSDVGYMRCELDGRDDQLELRTPIRDMYNSYTHAVLSNLDLMLNIKNISNINWDLTLVDEYEEYYTI